MISYAVVIPTIGRPGLAQLVATVDGDPAPASIVVADDRRDAAAQLDLPATRAPLIVVRTHGRGPAAARNAGWRATDADWIAFLDDDVAIPLDWCRRLVEDLDGLPDNVAASQAWIFVPTPEGRPPTDAERRTTNLSGALWITADMAYRRSALLASGGFDERFPRAFREDADLALRTVRLGYAIVWGERVTTHPLASSASALHRESATNVRRPSGASRRSPRSTYDPVSLPRRPGEASTRRTHISTAFPAQGTSWRSSLRAQAGNADNALMRAKYGRRWRSLIGTSQGRTGRHLLATGSATATLAALVAREVAPSRAHWARIALAAGLVWTGLTAEFAIGRILSGPRTAREISTVLVTSALIPPLAVAHRLRGEFRARFAGRTEPRVRSRKPRAVLFDRDGTLIENVPYLADPQRVRPMPGARRTLDQLRRRGVAVGVISNQSGVARGLINPDELAQVNARVESLLGPFDTWQVCPHDPDVRCNCRKPEPGLVIRAARELGVAPHECLMIGDIGSDVAAALAAGARAVLVPTRHTKDAEIDHAHRVAAVAPTLRSAVRRHVGRSR